VTAEIVNGHDVAGAECGQQYLLDMKAEALAVDGEKNPHRYESSACPGDGIGGHSRRVKWRDG
jgi:hypothetical protein